MSRGSNSKKKQSINYSSKHGGSKKLSNINNQNFESKIEKDIDRAVERTGALAVIRPFRRQTKTKSNFTFYLIILFIFALVIGISVLLYNLTSK